MEECMDGWIHGWMCRFGIPGCRLLEISGNWQSLPAIPSGTRRQGVASVACLYLVMTSGV